MALIRLIACALVLATAQCMSPLPELARRHLIEELGAAADAHVSVACNSYAVGPYPACFDQSVKAIGNVDYLPGAPEISYKDDGRPWGVHIGGPYPDGVTYLMSWYSGSSSKGPADNLHTPDTSDLSALVRVSTKKNGPWEPEFSGKVIAYKRAYTKESGNYPNSYVSPLISHVVLKNLEPKTTYYYQLYNMATQNWTDSYQFTTVRMGYPLSLGLIADVGQTVNSSDTRDHLISHKPDAVILTADFAYADNYGANNWTLPYLGSGTNQKRWDSWSVLWENLTSTTPLLGCAGNHEIESSGINAQIAYNITTFVYPDNYPFQSYSSRWPVPGTTNSFGNIDNNLYYATTIAGKVKLITLNNYIAFQPGSPQHTWAMEEFKNVNRDQTPWLIVQFHAPPYHTYYTHYKEQECFMSIYEDMFYQAGVDFVLNGHVHAYERTHPVYKYKVDKCGPIYITIGDGGNIEGPYRNFVDEISPLTNKTYCEMLSYGGKSPNEIDPSEWGPSYQRQAHPPNCPTLSWQPANNVKGGPVLVPKDGDSSLGFCQSSQPSWSAYRDPSFGHAILDIKSDTMAEYSWYRNVDKKMEVADRVELKRGSCSHSQRRRAMQRSRMAM